MEQVPSNTSELITIIYFNDKTRCLQYDPNIVKVDKNSSFVDNDGLTYRITYYNPRARVAFAILRD